MAIKVDITEKLENVLNEFGEIISKITTFESKAFYKKVSYSGYKKYRISDNIFLEVSGGVVTLKWKDGTSILAHLDELTQEDFEKFKKFVEKHRVLANFTKKLEYTIEQIKEEKRKHCL